MKYLLGIIVLIAIATNAKCCTTDSVCYKKAYDCIIKDLNLYPNSVFISDRLDEMASIFFIEDKSLTKEEKKTLYDAMTRINTSEFSPVLNTMQQQTWIYARPIVFFSIIYNNILTATLYIRDNINYKKLEDFSSITIGHRPYYYVYMMVFSETGELMKYYRHKEYE